MNHQWYVQCFHYLVMNNLSHDIWRRCYFLIGQNRVHFGCNLWIGIVCRVHTCALGGEVRSSACKIRLAETGVVLGLSEPRIGPLANVLNDGVLGRYLRVRTDQANGHR